MKTPKNRVAELDALRGIAALMVVFFHFTRLRPESELGFRLGCTGVDLFFMISGFVITMSIGRVSRGLDFVISRASRLYPTYWASVTFTFLLIIGKALFQTGSLNGVNGLHYLGNLTMFQFYLLMPDLDGCYWTMIIEMLFYIVVLFLFQLRWLKHIEKIGLAATLAVAGCALAWNNSFKLLFAAIPLLKFIPLFFAGINFYKIYTERTALPKRYTVLALCFASQVLLFACCGRARWAMNQVEYSLALIAYFGLFTLFVNGRLKFIVSKPTVFLGKISFALYLTHEYFGLDILRPFLMETLRLTFWTATLCVMLPAVLLVAALVTHFIEAPCSKRLKEWLHTRPAISFRTNGSTKKIRLEPAMAEESR